MPEFYPANDTPIDLGGNEGRLEEWGEYWKREVENLKYNCNPSIFNKYKIKNNLEYKSSNDINSYIYNIELTLK